MSAPSPLGDTAQLLNRTPEELLQLAYADPEQYAPLIRPAAQIDKAYRLIKEFLKPRARRVQWWDR